MFTMDGQGTKHTGVCGIEGFSAHEFGQEICCLAQALYESGYTDITPSKVANHLNNVNSSGDNAGWLPNGLVDMTVMASEFPQIKVGKPGYALVQGTLGVRMHTLLRRPDGTFGDPLSGNDGIPQGWWANGCQQTFFIQRKA